ncbi:MAG: hypothetical protein ACI9C4_000719 [Paraglaciecola sp.]|jgi:hypothetical protein
MSGDLSKVTLSGNGCFLLKRKIAGKIGCCIPFGQALKGLTLRGSNSKEHHYYFIQVP